MNPEFEYLHRIQAKNRLKREAAAAAVPRDEGNRAQREQGFNLHFKAKEIGAPKTSPRPQAPNANSRSRIQIRRGGWTREPPAFIQGGRGPTGDKAHRVPTFEDNSRSQQSSENKRKDQTGNINNNSFVGPDNEDDSCSFEEGEYEQESFESVSDDAVAEEINKGEGGEDGEVVDDIQNTEDLESAKANRYSFCSNDSIDASFIDEGIEDVSEESISNNDKEQEDEIAEVSLEIEVDEMTMRECVSNIRESCDDDYEDDIFDVCDDEIQVIDDSLRVENFANQKSGHVPGRHFSKGGSTGVISIATSSFQSSNERARPARRREVVKTQRADMAHRSSTSDDARNTSRTGSCQTNILTRSEQMTLLRRNTRDKSSINDKINAKGGGGGDGGNGGNVGQVKGGSYIHGTRDNDNIRATPLKVVNVKSATETTNTLVPSSSPPSSPAHVVTSIKDPASVDDSVMASRRTLSNDASDLRAVSPINSSPPNLPTKEKQCSASSSPPRTFSSGDHSSHAKYSGSSSPQRQVQSKLPPGSASNSGLWLEKHVLDLDSGSTADPTSAQVNDADVTTPAAPVGMQSERRAKPHWLTNDDHGDVKDRHIGTDRGGGEVEEEMSLLQSFQGLEMFRLTNRSRLGVSVGSPSSSSCDSHEPSIDTTRDIVRTSRKERKQSKQQGGACGFTGKRRHRQEGKTQAEKVESKDNSGNTSFSLGETTVENRRRAAATKANTLDVDKAKTSEERDETRTATTLGSNLPPLSAEFLLDNSGGGDDDELSKALTLAKKEGCNVSAKSVRMATFTRILSSGSEISGNGHRLHARPNKEKLAAVQAAVKDAVESVYSLGVGEIQKDNGAVIWESDLQLQSSNGDDSSCISASAELEVKDSNIINGTCNNGSYFGAASKDEKGNDCLVDQLQQSLEWWEQSDNDDDGNIEVAHGKQNIFGDTDEVSCESPDGSGLGGSNDASTPNVVLPPRGRVLRLVIHSTWGDPNYVGLAGIEVFDIHGEHLTPVAVTEQPPRDPANFDPRMAWNLFDGFPNTCDDLHMWLVPTAANSTSTEKNKRSCKKSACSCHNTLEIVLAPPPDKQHELKATVTLGCVRFWNYNRSRIHSQRGVCRASLWFDDELRGEQLIFEGELDQAPGLLLKSGDNDKRRHPLHPLEQNWSQSIFFFPSADRGGEKTETTRASSSSVAIPETFLAAIKDYDRFELGLNYPDESKQTISKAMARSYSSFDVSSFSQMLSTPNKEELDQAAAALGTPLGHTSPPRSNSSASFLSTRFLPSFPSEPHGNVSNVLVEASGGGWMEGTVLSMKILSTWGDLSFVGLTSIEVLSLEEGGIGGVHSKLGYEKEGRGGSIGQERVRRISILPSAVRFKTIGECSQDTATPGRLVDDFSQTCDPNHMWLTPLSSTLSGGGTTAETDTPVLTFDLGSTPVCVWGVRVFNYNKNSEDCDKGARQVVACVHNHGDVPRFDAEDVAGVTKPNNIGNSSSSSSSSSSVSFVLRRAPGHSLIDFGQTVRFASCLQQQKLSETQQSSTVNEHQRQQLRQQRPVASLSSSEYEHPRTCPVGMFLRIVIHSNWGDLNCVGLDRIEIITTTTAFASSSGAVASSSSSPVRFLRVRPEQICAAPAFLTSPVGAGGSDSEKADVLLLAPLAATLTAMAVTKTTTTKTETAPIYSQNQEHSLKLPPSRENEFYVLLDVPTVFAGIRIWNYSKNPPQGARNVSLFLDGKLVHRTTLSSSQRQHQPKLGGCDSSTTMIAHESILLTSNPLVVAAQHSLGSFGGRGEGGSSGSDEQQVTCFDEGKVAVKERKEQNNGQAGGSGVAVAQNIIVRAGKTCEGSLPAQRNKSIAVKPTDDFNDDTSLMSSSWDLSGTLPNSLTNVDPTSISNVSAYSPFRSNPALQAASTTIETQETKAANSVKCRVLQLVDASTPLGHPSFSTPRVGCAAMRCLSCNFSVLRVPHHAWDKSKVSYLFLRNFFDPGHPEKLISALERSEGAAAYACQCSWRTVPKGAQGERSGVEKVGLDVVCCSGDGKPLKWSCLGH